MLLLLLSTLPLLRGMKQFIIRTVMNLNMWMSVLINIRAFDQQSAEIASFFAMTFPDKGNPTSRRSSHTSTQWRRQRWWLQRWCRLCLCVYPGASAILKMPPMAIQKQTRRWEMEYSFIELLNYWCVTIIDLLNYWGIYQSCKLRFNNTHQSFNYSTIQHLV